jgi:hypothetical protein
MDTSQEDPEMRRRRTNFEEFDSNHVSHKEDIHVSL